MLTGLPAGYARLIYAAESPRSALGQKRLDNAKGPVIWGLSKYRYRDSNPGFRHERAAS
jgi:hypothetical protein